MSSRSYSISGFGCYTYKLSTSKEKFLNLLKEANLENKLKEIISAKTDIEANEIDIKNINVTKAGYISYNDVDIIDENIEFFDYYSCHIGLNMLALAISNEIKTKTGEEGAVEYIPCSDGCTDAILMEACMPWFYPEHNITPLTRKEYEEIFVKWINLYGKDETVDDNQLFEWVDVEQFG